MMCVQRFAIVERRTLLAVLALGVTVAAWPLYSHLRDERDFRRLTPKQHVVAAMRICYAETPVASAQNFERHLAAISKDYWAYELAARCQPVVKAQADRPEDFESFTPEQHYAAAIYVCKHAPRRPEMVTFGADADCLLKSAKDFSRVIRHLEAIPKDSHPYEDAARALRLVKMQRDQPKDFEAARAADYQQCTAAAQTRLGPGVCGNYIDEVCNLFSARTAATKVIGTIPWHTSDQDLFRGVAEWRREKP